MHKYASWIDEHSPAESLDILCDIALTHTPHTGSHRGALEKLIKTGNFRALCEYELNYSEVGLTAHAVMHIRQVTALFSKLKHLEIGVDREKLAVQKFLQAEAKCKETNELLRSYRRGDFRFEKSVDAVISTARFKIAKVLGNCPTLDKLVYRFGPGATRGVKRKIANPLAKLAEPLSCSESLFPYVSRLLSCMPAYADAHLEEQFLEEDDEGNWIETSSWNVLIQDAQLTFQPKSATSLRAAVTENGLNVLGQLAIGDEMARRMRSWVIDIKDQTLNQRRALLGSIGSDCPEDSHLREATVDLVSASDTISRELVAELVSIEWFQLLDAFRSHTVALPDGSVIEQDKMSSMGNGYTFPLETLIFWALASSCCHQDSHCSVYGDDIVVPAYAIPLLYSVLHAVGFEVNRKKSFHDGPFRESCGRDYFRGIAVRPYYQKEWVSARTLFVLHNFYVRQGDMERAKTVLEFIHPALVRFGPDGYGDGHLLGQFMPRRKPRQVARGYGGYVFSTFTLRPRKVMAVAPGDFLFPLYSIYRRAAETIQVPVPLRSGLHRSFGGKRTYPQRGFSFEYLSPAPLQYEVSSETSDSEYVSITVPGDDGYKSVDIYTLS